MTRIDRTKPAEADSMIVLVGGRSLCATSNSRWLDPQAGGYKPCDGRNDAARRIALCWNACRHLTDEQLADTTPDTIARLTAEPAGEDVNPVSLALMYLEGGFIECPRCGEEVPTKDLDATYELQRAVSEPAGEDVERVARSLYETYFAGAWECASQTTQETWRKLARAAIAALHPTDDLRRTREAEGIIAELMACIKDGRRVGPAIAAARTFLSTVSKEREK